MKRVHWAQLAIVNLLFTGIIIAPFLPGPPNKLVIGISVLAQSAGFFGLFLIPVGIAWTVVEIRKWRRKEVNVHDWKFAYGLAIVATIVITFIYCLFILGLYISSEILGAVVAVLAGAVIWWFVIKKIKKLKHPLVCRLNTTPLYLISIPLIALVARLYLIAPLSNYSRELTIQRSQALIALIEDYKNKTGEYPASINILDAHAKIPRPNIMGILDFRYNKIDDHYSLSFSQWLDFGSLEEIVLYDKKNLHKTIDEYSAYTYTLDLHRVNGAFAVYNTRHSAWRYYHVD